MATSPAPSATPAGGATTPLPHRVAGRWRETADTWTLELEPESRALPSFAPGQFAMLYAFGAGEVPISLSADGSSPGSLQHTVRDVGSVTAALCAAEPGGIVGVRGPFGTPWPLERAEGRDVVVMAGGIGLAPLRPALRRIVEDRDRYGAAVLMYGGRSPAELLYPEEVARWREGGLDAQVIVDSAGADWTGRVGVVTELLSRTRFRPDEAVAMLCGPEVMMRHAAAALERRGVPAERVFVSLERNMKCATGHCGHCQLGPAFVCKDGAVFPYDRVAPLLSVREL